jgi:exonuclease VII small subunit
MTDFTEDYYPEDPFDTDGCVLGDKCLHHDPNHTSDECFDAEYIEKYYKEANRDTPEYKQGFEEAENRIKAIVEELEASSEMPLNANEYDVGFQNGYAKACYHILARMEEDNAQD